MSVCVLLVAALAGQPAWGDGEKEAKQSGSSAQNAAGSGKSKANSAKAKKATAKKSSSAKAGKKKAWKKAAGAKAKKAKSKAKKKAARQQIATELVATEPPPAPDENAPDPTPAPASEPPPVDTGEATPAPPEAETPNAETPAPEPAPSEVAPPEAIPAPTGNEDPAGAVAAPPAPSEEATAGGLGKKTITPDATPPPVVADGSATPGGRAPGDETPPGADPTGEDSPATANGPSGGTAAGELPALGNAAIGGAPSPIIAGAITPQAAQDLLVGARPGTRSSDPQNRSAIGVGRLSQPSSLGLSQVSDFVKDIPAQIKLALAGLVLAVLLLGAYTILAAARTRRLERQRSKLMEDIGLLQAALLPAVPGRLGALLTTVAYRPADGPAAGGDFYDAFALSDGRVGLLLGDISGHGRQALAKTTLVRFTVRAHLEAGMSPREALAISGRSLDGRLADDFSTVIAAIHDPVKGTLTYASAGHPPPLVIGPPAHEPVTASSAPPIGAGFPTGQRQTVLPMPEGTTVCVYSDGLLEARVAGDALGRDRLGSWLRELGPEATAKALLDLVVQRADRVPDDLAACVLHAAPGATAPAARVEQLKLDVLDVEGPELEGFLKACGVSRADRSIAGRRVSEQLAVSGGVVVDVRIGEHPMVSVASIGEHASGGSRPASRVR